LSLLANLYTGKIETIAITPVHRHPTTKVGSSPPFPSRHYGTLVFTRGSAACPRQCLSRRFAGVATDSVNLRKLHPPRQPSLARLSVRGLHEPPLANSRRTSSPRELTQNRREHPSRRFSFNASGGNKLRRRANSRPSLSISRARRPPRLSGPSRAVLGQNSLTLELTTRHKLMSRSHQGALV